MSDPGERPGRETPVADRPVHVTAAEDRVAVARKIAYGLGPTSDMRGNWLYPGLVWPVFKLFLHVSPARPWNAGSISGGELEARWG